MLEFVDNVVMQFKGCFSRKATFHWFVVVVIGGLLRMDSFGVTSVIRDLNLNPTFYTSLLGYFRSSAWRMDLFVNRWVDVVLKSGNCKKINGRCILIGDGVKQNKEGLKMPGVKKHVQESGNSGKPKYIFGHLFGVVGILAGNFAKMFCIPLSAGIQDGVDQIRKFADQGAEAVSHVVQVMRQAGSIAKRTGIAYLLLDAYFLSKPALCEAEALIDDSGKHLMQVVTRAKSSAIAYQVPPPYSGRGRPPKKGDRIKLKTLFASHKHEFTKTKAGIYGKKRDVMYYSVDLLWGAKLYKKLRFVLVCYEDTQIILVSTCLETTPLQIIELYSYRFKIECGFRSLKQTVRGFSYHFWCQSMHKLNQFNRKKNTDAMDAIKDKDDQKRIVRTLQATEAYVSVSLISLGLLQMLSLNYSDEINKKSYRWLRTVRNRVVSEETVAGYFRHDIDCILADRSDLNIVKIIKSKQAQEKHHTKEKYTSVGNYLHM